jgi:excisionase family DNA binding protein
MTRHSFPDPAHTEPLAPDAVVPGSALGDLPNRLLTVFEVAKYVVCHEETVRRAYLRGLLKSQRFGVRGRRFWPADVRDWFDRGMPTKVPDSPRGSHGHQAQVQ